MSGVTAWPIISWTFSNVSHLMADIMHWNIKTAFEWYLYSAKQTNKQTFTTVKNWNDAFSFNDVLDQRRNFVQECKQNQTNLVLQACLWSDFLSYMWQPALYLLHWAAVQFLRQHVQLCSGCDSFAVEIGRLGFTTCPRSYHLRQQKLAGKILDP